MLLAGGSVLGDVFALGGALKGLIEIAGARGLCRDWKVVIAATRDSGPPGV